MPRPMTKRLRLLGPVERHETLDSTNRLAAQRAAEGAPEGLVVRADRQEQGRGRRERTWHSPRGGLWLTAVLRPSSLEGLSLAAGLACVRAVRRYQVPATLRWPNDVFVGDRKLAGVLAEGRFQGAAVSYALVGLGLNVDLGAEDFPPELQGLATSMRLELGTAPRLDEVQEILLDELDAAYVEHERGGLAALHEEICAACSTLGRRVRVLAEGGPTEGVAASIGADGSLVLDDGRAFYSVERVEVL